MIFQYTLEQVLSGAKTATRRPVNPKTDSAVRDDDGQVVAVLVNGREKWRVGKTYAIQPSRNAPSVGRIRVTALDEQPLNAITDAEAQAEGAADRAGFFALWQQVHGDHDKTDRVWVVRFEVVR
jgi:uncharacterized protein YhfF